MGFSIEYIDEPTLMFGNDGEAIDPRSGLLKYGPRTPTSSSDPISMKIGLIGSSQSISEIHRLFKDMRSRILPNIDSPKKWRPPFPGLSKNSPLNISINFQKRWRKIFTPSEVKEILSPGNRDKIIENLLTNIQEKVRIIYGKETPPDVIIISIPDKIYEKCKSASAIKPKIQTKESDFHSRIKLQGMKLGLPTQLIHPDTMKEKGTQDKADIAWNLAVGLLYKSQKGHPWKIAELEENTCFAGISFYIQRGKREIQTKAAMAQVFLDTGESFILRGDQLKEAEGKYQNHLSRIDAERITKKILKQYRDHRNGSSPERLVIHKSSNFWAEEKEGIQDAASCIEKLDLITIREIHPINLFSSGDYPVLRGTLVSAPGGKEHYLYTTGFIPTLGTYPAPRIPRPLVVKPDPDISSTPIQDTCKEILAFTKLDWNSSHFCKKLPVTIEVSRSVGAILAESLADDIEIDPHYYFYM